MTELIHVKGLQEIRKQLLGLTPKIESKVVRPSLRTGAKEIQKVAKSKVPVKDGDLLRSIKVKTSSRKGRLKATIVAGDKVAFYAKMVEMGTAEHLIKPKKRKSLFLAGLAKEIVHHPGAAPHPYMRPALDAGSEPAINAFANDARARLEKLK